METNLLELFQARWDDIMLASMQHIELTVISLILANLIAIPLGVFLTRYQSLAEFVIGIAAMFQTIPSLALLGFMIPLLGIGPIPAIVALTVYGLLPVLRNTYTGILGVDRASVEAGTGMGMTQWQVLFMVQLPLALPIIMAGVRTATVLLVGVATLAALIGAGGLGDLIFRGISMANPQLILAGAIPSALLALVFDYGLKWVEKSVTPQGLRAKGGAAIVVNKFCWLLLVCFITTMLVGCTLFGGDKQQIIIGGKNFSEQDILVHMMEYVIEDKTGLTVGTKPFLGGTSVVAQAIERGDIHIYAEYTGTALINILGESMTSDPEAVYEKVKQIYEEQKGLIWLKPFGFNNTYTLSMRDDRAAALGIKTFSDLAQKAPNLTLGSTQEFLERSDGYKGLQKTYNIDFKSTSGMDPGLTYAAVRDGKVDVIDAFATDGRIIAFNLRVLEDDKHFFPPYYAAPVVRADTLAKYPEIADALNSLAGKLNDKEMAALNAQVDLEKKDPKVVARAWLKANGLIK
ncbi:MAG: glycine betaine ABC transporter substrate-binding protein [Negativicutes bacterium]|mgnify:CR=1 FL=1